MSDIVERLRRFAGLPPQENNASLWAMEAATEIERLREQHDLALRVHDAMASNVTKKINTARSDALEEAALVAEDTGKRAIIEGYGMIVFAIRSLKEKI